MIWELKNWPILEIVSAIVHQLTQRSDYLEQIEEHLDFDQYYVDHTVGIWPQAARWSALECLRHSRVKR